MPWSGGNYTKWNGSAGWTDDFNNNIGIEPGRHDTQDTDFQDGINQCLNKDGSNAATGDLDLGNYKITNLGEATANGQAVRYNQLTDGSPLGVNFTSNRVGVGTSSPAWIVDVVRNANDASSLVSMTNPNAGTSASGGFRLVNDTSNANLRLNSSANTISGGGGANALVLENNASGPIHFDTGGGIRATIVGSGSTTGFFGLNQEAPAVFFDASRSANDTLTRLRVRNASSGSSAQTQINLGNNTSDTATVLGLNSSANTGDAGANSFNIFHGLAAPIRVRAGGSGGVDLASTATSWAAVSDERFKKNIQPLSYGLTEITALNPIRFDYTEDASESSARIGFTAQSVQLLVPEAVGGSLETQLTLSTTELIPALVGAIKELNSKIETLETRIAALEA